LSYRDLNKKIKNKEYERLDTKTKTKLIKRENIEVQDFIKKPIIIKSSKTLNKEELKQNYIRTY